MQSRIASLIETLLSTFIGFIISYIINLFVFKSLGCSISPHENFVIVSLFTIVSVLRSFGVRRLFVYLHHKYNF